MPGVAIAGSSCKSVVIVARSLAHSHPLSGVAYCLGEMKNTAKANRIAGCPLLVHKSPLVIFIAFSKHKDSLILKTSSLK